MSTFTRNQISQIISSFYYCKDGKQLLRAKQFFKERNAQFLGIGQTRIVFSVTSKNKKYAVKIEHAKGFYKSNKKELDNYYQVDPHLKCKLVDSFCLEYDEKELLILVFEQLTTVSLRKNRYEVFDIDDIMIKNTNNDLLKTFLESLPKPVKNNKDLKKLRNRIIDLYSVSNDVHIFNLGWDKKSVLPKLLDFDIK